MAAAPAPAPVTVLAQQDLTSFDTAFVTLVDRALASPGVALLAVAAAVGVGALHALAPGHGKTIAAAYLAGGRGRARDAVLLGWIVAGMHTASVVVLALVMHLVLGDAGDPAILGRATPLLRVAAGVIVALLGGSLLVAQWRRRGHGGDHRHPSLPPEVSPLSRRGLVVLGVSGGLLPSPAAFLVLVTTTFTGRTALGVALVVAFSAGLAATLTAVGLAAVWGRELLLRRFRVTSRMRAVAAVAAAVAVLAGGVVLAVSGLLALP